MQMTIWIVLGLAFAGTGALAGDKKVGLDKAVIASALHVDVVHTIPSDFDTVQKSLINGKPITGNSGVGKEFAALGDLLAGREKPTVTRTAPFGGLFSLFSPTSS